MAKGAVSLSSIDYRGYLLKRSNQPLSASELEQRIREKDEQVDDLMFPTCSDSDVPLDSTTEIIQEKDDEYSSASPQFHIEAGEKVQDSPGKKSLSQLEAFFGIPTKSNIEPDQLDTTPELSSEVIPSHAIEINHTKSQPVAIATRSLPISFTRPTEEEEDISHMLVSSLQMGESLSECSPDDFIANDGHVWRAKYCIFTEGVLYFYQNKECAYSLEAQKERDNDSPDKQHNEPSIDLLSKSPMPRSFLPTPSLDIASRTKKGTIWEKRVALENVGACRSSVEEYGLNSFVLLTHDSDEDCNSPVDMLVLKAGSAKEMDEWMLQFQRSIASLMRKMILSVDSSVCPSLTNQHMYNKKFRHKLSSPKTSSPMYHATSSSPVLPPFMSLSHGHGRNDLHRRLLLPKEKHSPKPHVTKGGSSASPLSLVPPVLPDAGDGSGKLGTNALKKPPPAIKKYVPPHLRKTKNESGDKYIPPHLRKKQVDSTQESNEEGKKVVEVHSEPVDLEREDERESEDTSAVPINIMLGGCAETPTSTKSRRSKFKAQSFGSFGGMPNSLKWEIGAISELGKRDSNEDAFVCASNFPIACNRNEVDEDIKALFAVFDGHCGSSSAKFAANNIVSFLEDARKTGNSSISTTSVSNLMQEYLLNALSRLDHEICSNSEWESGSTAIVAMIVGEEVILANLGDCRGVLCCKSTQIPNDGKWKIPELNYGDPTDETFFYREIARTHNPYREDEKERIQSANGWITREQEICISQLQRVDLFDKDVVDILKRCFSERLSGSNLSAYDGELNDGTPTRPAPGRVFHTSRVCGELAVSRALGDKDFKARYSKPTDINGEDGWWEGPNFLPYPLDHNMCFKNDLITSIPDVEIFTVGEHHVNEEFLILACDGLWDVMDLDDAVIVARDLLFKKRVSAEVAVSFVSFLQFCSFVAHYSTFSGGKTSRNRHTLGIGRQYNSNFNQILS